MCPNNYRRHVMKQCYNCKQEKKLKEFNNSKRYKDGKNYICKSCKREYDNKYYKNKEGRKEQITSNRKNNLENNKEYIIQYLLNNPCIDCGESNPFFLEFDHTKDKRDNVSALRNHGLDTLKKEIDKCEIRCVKCHKIKTAKRAGWYDSYQEKVAKLSGIGNAPDL